jgi:hypothetical protein
MKADAELSHAEQYKMLRAEIMEHMCEIYRTERACLAGVFAVYTWLLLHQKPFEGQVVWFVAPTVIFLCSLRSIHHIVHMRKIAKYLRKIENSVFKQDAELPGWENDKARSSTRWDRIDLTTFAITWGALFFVSILASWYFSR